MKPHQRKAIRHDLAAITAVHATDWDAWRSFVTDHPTERERARGQELAEHLSISPDAGSAAIRDAMTADHRRELRVVLEHVAAQDRWTVGTSPEIQRVGELLWSHRREAATTGLPDDVRRRHRTELVETLTDEHIDRLDGDGNQYRGFTDGRYRWHTTLDGGDEWLPRHPIPEGLPGAGTAADLNQTLTADLRQAATAGLNPPLSTGPGPSPAAGQAPQTTDPATAAHRPPSPTRQTLTRD